jgi:hypothetical protein
MRISDCIRINNGQNLKIIVTMLSCYNGKVVSLKKWGRFRIFLTPLTIVINLFLVEGHQGIGRLSHLRITNDGAQPKLLSVHCYINNAKRNLFFNIEPKEVKK